jgi:hypothetical protein
VIIHSLRPARKIFSFRYSIVKEHLAESILVLKSRLAKTKSLPSQNSRAGWKRFAKSKCSRHIGSTLERSSLCDLPMKSSELPCGTGAPLWEYSQSKAGAKVPGKISNWFFMVEIFSSKLSAEIFIAANEAEKIAQ